MGCQMKNWHKETLKMEKKRSTEGTGRLRLSIIKLLRRFQIIQKRNINW